MINKRSEFSGKVIVSKSNSNRSLYKHQIEAIKALNSTSSLEKYKGMLVIPTGGGKTFTTVYWIMNQMINKDKKVLWLAHRHELLNQTIDTVINKASFKDIVTEKVSFTYRIISGLDEHDRPVNIEEDDDFIIASKDSLIRGKEYLEKWVEANKNNICIVIDEAHHAVAKTYRSIIDLVEKYSDQWIRLIGLTATPTRTSENEKGLLKKVFPDDICYSVDLNTLITEGILSKPILIENSTNTGIRKELTTKELEYIRRTGILPENIAKEITLNKERNNFIVKEYIKNKEMYGKTLIFAINIDHAIALNALFKDKGIKSEFIVSALRDSYTGATVSAEENALKIKDFRDGNLDILINVNILTEGTDIPNIQTVFLTRPTTSSILLNQMIGRGLRGIKAGGTKEAYIVSFIDDWKYKINWVSPRNLEIGQCIETPYKNGNSYEQHLISIKLIEELAIYMNKTVKAKEKNTQYKEYSVAGAYIFTNIYDENDEEEERDCQVLVFNHLKHAYEEFIDGLPGIDKIIYNSVETVEDEIENLIPYINKKYFSGYDLSIGYKEDDIKEILYFYLNSGIKPKFTEIELEIGLNNTIEVEAPEIINPPLNYNKLSMSQIRSINPEFWRQLRDRVFEKYTDSEGYYNSNTGLYKSKSRRYFEIDHIIPISKGGETTLDNLQLLTRWENKIKGVKTQEEFINELAESNNYYIDKINNVEFLEEILIHEYDKEEGLEKSKELAENILDHDENNLTALNLLGRIAHLEEKYRSALIYANKVLSQDKTNVFALYTKGFVYFEKENFKESIKFLELVEKLKPTFEGYKTLGDCYLKIKKKDIALGYYYKALNEEENNIEALSDLYFNMGDIYFSKRKYEEALKCYSKVVEIEPEQDCAINNSGVCLERVGKLKEALKYYKKAHKICSEEKLYKENIDKIIERIKS